MADKILDDDEVMFRQIHPSSLQNGEPASDRFRPYASDGHLMSVDRSALITAEQSHSLYTSTGRKSAAVFGVSVREFGDEAIDCLIHLKRLNSSQLIRLMPLLITQNILLLSRN